MSTKLYTLELFDGVIRLVAEQGYSVREVAQRFLGTTSSLYKWLNELKKTPHLAAMKYLHAKNARSKGKHRSFEEGGVRLIIGGRILFQGIRVMYAFVGNIVASII